MEQRGASRDKGPGRADAASPIQRRLAASFGAQGLQLIARTAQQVGLVPILIYFWGNDAYEDWLVVVATAGFVPLAELGTQAYLGNLMLAAYSSGEPGRFNAALSLAVGVQGLTAGAAILCAVFLSAAIDWRALLGIENPGPIALAFLCLGNLGAVPFATLSAIYKARGQYSRYINFGTLLLVLEAAGVAIAVALGGDMSAAAAVFAFSVGLSWLLLVLDLKRKYPDIRWSARLPTPEEWRDLRRFAPLYFVNSATNIVSVSAPIIVLKNVAAPGAVVAYSIFRLMTGMLRQIAHQMALATGAEMAGQFFRHELHELHKLFRFAGALLAIVFGSMAALFRSVAPPLLAIWTHETVRFDPILLDTFLASVFLILPGLLSLALLYYVSRPAPISIAHGAYSALGLALCALLAPRLGATGAALGMAIPEVLLVGLWLTRTACRMIDVPFIRFIVTTYALGGVSFGISHSVSAPLAARVMPDSWGEFILVGLSWTLVMSLPLALLFLAARRLTWSVAAPSSAAR